MLVADGNPLEHVQLNRQQKVPADPVEAGSGLTRSRGRRAQYPFRTCKDARPTAVDLRMPMLALGTVPFDSAAAASLTREAPIPGVVGPCLHRVPEVRRDGWSARNENRAARSWM